MGVLSGKQERPDPVVTGGYGAGFVSMDRDQSNVHLNMAWGRLSGPDTVGHFHIGLSSQTGPVVFNLMPFFNATTPPGAADAYWNTANAAPNDANPFTAKRALQFQRDGTGTLRASDLLVRTVLPQAVNVRPGTNRTEVKVPSAADVYLLMLNDSRIVSRVTKQ